MQRARRSIPVVGALAALVLAVPLLPAGTAGASSGCDQACISQAAAALVSASGGPPGIIVQIDHGGSTQTVIEGVADTATKQVLSTTAPMRVASVAKAFSGAIALSLVSQGKLKVTDTIGKLLPSMPRRWWKITLAQLLQHTSRLPDFSGQKSFQKKVLADPQTAPPPEDLLDSVKNLPLLDVRGNGYHYSNTDNIVVGLIVQAVTHESYQQALASLVSDPLGLMSTSLPSTSVLDAPYLHGYDVAVGQEPEDVSTVLNPGWSWTSGGVVSTPADLMTFVRAYVSGKLINTATRQAQFRFVTGSSGPPGPGKNAAGLALFRYSMKCGTMYGHTGNTLGYTQFMAASANGADSVTVSVNGQITPERSPKRFKALRAIELEAACSALGK